MKKMEKPLFKGVVLICDDNNMNLMLLSEHLRQVGLEVIVSPGGHDAVEKVQNRAQLPGGNKQFDLVLMDIHMPDMDGIEAAEKIHSIDNRIPIIAVTTDKRFSNPEKFRQNGILDYLGKPFEPQQLWNCLGKYLVTQTS